MHTAEPFENKPLEQVETEVGIAVVPDGSSVEHHRKTPVDDHDAELEAALEYKIFGGGGRAVAEILEMIARIVARRVP